MADTKYTGDDLDALYELRASSGYRLIEGRLTGELERHRRELERPADERTTAMARGAIAALRMVLSLPSILEDEIKSEVKEQQP
jgi:hypothetical protein